MAILTPEQVKATQLTPEQMMAKNAPIAEGQNSVIKNQPTTNIRIASNTPKVGDPIQGTNLNYDEADIANLGSQATPTPSAGLTRIPPDVATPAPVTTATAPAFDTSAVKQNVAVTPNPEVKTEDEIYKEANKRALEQVQAQIDQVNQQYSSELSAAQREGAQYKTEEMGKTNALSALMGLSGTSAQQERAGSTGESVRKVNQSREDVINARKSQALSQIYGNVSNNAQRLAEAALSTNKENQKAIQDQVSTDALNAISGIALSANGKTWSDFKKTLPDMASQLVQQSGKSEYELSQLWNQAIPEQYKPIVKTIYSDDGKGGTTMKQISVNPGTKEVQEQDFNIPGVSAEVFNGPEKPLEVNGMLLVKQSDGTYKNVAPTSETQTIDNAYKQAQIDKIKAETVALNNPNAADVIVSDPLSGDILSQTGLSIPSFAYLTQGVGALTRMSATQRLQYMKEAENFAKQKGIDISTFQSQYKGLSKTVEANVLRNNQAAVSESELEATISNIRNAAEEAGLSDLKGLNAAKIFLGQQLNKPEQATYKFHLEQIRNEFAMYNAAISGQIDANGNIRQINDSDYRKAEEMIQNGFAAGSIDGFETALKASMSKMGTVLQSSIDAQNKQVWKLFGVGQNYKNKNSAYTPGSTIEYEGKTYKVAENGEDLIEQ